MRIQPLLAVVALAISAVAATAQTVKWSYTVDVPAGYVIGPPSYYANVGGRTAVESLLDGYGGSLWVIRISPEQGSDVNRVVWLGANGTALYTNDFVINGTTYYAFVPIRLISLTRNEAVFQHTAGSRTDQSEVNVLVRLTKTRAGVTRTDFPLGSRESVGAAETLHGAADSKGYFTRQFVGGDYEYQATQVVIRRYSK